MPLPVGWPAPSRALGDSGEVGSTDSFHVVAGGNEQSRRQDFGAAFEVFGAVCCNITTAEREMNPSLFLSVLCRPCFGRGPVKRVEACAKLPWRSQSPGCAYFWRTNGLRHDAQNFSSRRGEENRAVVHLTITKQLLPATQIPKRQRGKMRTEQGTASLFLSLANKPPPPTRAVPTCRGAAQPKPRV